MNDTPTTVTVSFEEYIKLQEARTFLNILKNHGCLSCRIYNQFHVDNWEGYDAALYEYKRES